MDEQIAALEAYIADKVAEGFTPRDSIIEQTVDYALDQPCPEFRPLVERLTDAALLRHLAEQASWTEPTDCDKLDAAFAALEAQGVVARQDFACCNTCGFAEIEDEVRAPRCGRPPVGFAFYHSQDTESARDGGAFWIKFGSVSASHPPEDIGWYVLIALQEAGLDAAWNGDPDTAVQVGGLVWRKRRTDGPPLVAE